MRSLTTLLAWLITTVMLAVAVPATWMQHNLVEDDGFAALSQRAAQNPVLQTAVAGELASQAVWLIRERGFNVDYPRVRDIATAYTASPAFPPRFARVMAGVHRNMFAENGSDEWDIDLAAMLDDREFRPTMTDYDVQEPSALTAPVVVSAPEALRSGQLRLLADWSRRVGLGAGALAGLGALLTLAVARRRGLALAGLGVSGLLAAGIGGVGAAVVHRQLTAVLGASLNNTEATIRKIADVMVATGVNDLQHWLSLTAVAGAAVTVSGLAVMLLGRRRKSAGQVRA